MLNLISGHQTLQRRARSICYTGRVTDAIEERRVAAVWLKVSNSGKAEGIKTALQLAPDGTLKPIERFDWNEWEGGNSGGAKHESKVKAEHLRELFEDGRRRLSLKAAAEQLQEMADVGRTAAYDALKIFDGRFSDLLSRDSDGLIGLRPEPVDKGEEGTGEG